jgi:hypothetical protein
MFWLLEGARWAGSRLLLQWCCVLLLLLSNGVLLRHPIVKGAFVAE